MVGNLTGSKRVEAHLGESARVKLQARKLAGPIVRAAEAIATAMRNGGTLFIMGNGGSAADAQHLAAEFISKFKLKRRALPALALTTDSSILSAIGNDLSFNEVFSRQLEGLAKDPNDIVLAISTSGMSRNVLRALALAKKRKLRTIGLTGAAGALRELVEFPISVPSTDTQHIQETHLAIEHVLCDLVEQQLSHES